jgi:putative ATP-dependent endonuclease of OLD family
MIAIDRVRIHGFRGIYHLEMPLGEDSVLIGPNNCGKSTVLRALEAALSEAVQLTPDDLHIKADQTRVSTITVDMRMIPVADGHRRQPVFDNIWRTVFGRAISLDRHHREFLALRSEWTVTDGTFARKRFCLTNWETQTPGFEVENIPDCLKFVCVYSDNTLDGELKKPLSFINQAIEKLDKAVKAYPELAREPIADLRNMINLLSQTIEGPGVTLPEHIPFTAERIHHFFKLMKESPEVFPKLASTQGHGHAKTTLLLSTVSFLDMLTKKAEALNEPLFVLVCAEEPEVHLHPNAQRSLMAQLKTLSNQLILTTHSPFIVSACEPHDILAMERVEKGIRVNWLPRSMDALDTRMLKRLVFRYRAEVLFARGLVFVEGVTEEQLIRGMFQAYFGHDPSEYGISIIGVDGKSYAPFLTMAMSFRKPFVVISDNDGDTSHVVRKQLADIERKLRYTRDQNASALFFLSPGLAIEGELVHKTKLRREIVDALVMSNSTGNEQPDSHQRLKRRRLMSLPDKELKRRLEKKKSEYSGFLGDIIAQNPYNQTIDDMIPVPILRAFEKIQEWVDIKI